MKTSIVAIIGISMVLAFEPFCTAQNAPIDAQAQQDVSSRGSLAKRALELRVAGEAREHAARVAKAKAMEADAATKIAEDMAARTSEAKAALIKLQKRMAKQKADMEAQALKNAEQKAWNEIKINEALAAREAQVKAAEAAMAERQAQIKQAEASIAEREAMMKQMGESLAIREAKVKEVEKDLEARGEMVKQRMSAIAMMPGRVLPAEPTAMSKAFAKKASAVKSKKQDPDQWRVAASMLVRRIGAQSFKTMGSYSAGYPIGAKFSSGSWVGDAGRMGDVGNRVYDDGYVKGDDYTDLDSGTWNWGYDSGLQVHGNQIEMSGADRVWREASRQTISTEMESRDDAAYRAGLMVEMERYIAKIGYTDYGLSLGLLRAQTFNASAGGINTFNDNQRVDTYESRVLDAYDITGLGITPGSPPYHGNRETHGPVIDATPMTRQGMGTDMVASDSYRAYNSVAESLDMDLSTLSLGMSVKGHYRRVYLIGSTGPTLNMVDKDASYEETLYESSSGGMPQVLQYWNDTSSGTEYLLGYYVQAELGVLLYHQLHLGVFGRYDWLENVSGTVGPSRYEVNPSGGSMGGTIGINF
ncbi:MAG: cell envelope integrity protein TolA [Kiritimatiellae bacterium]|nr:cell envelope integrity protein TolA [Kiritimatiellia bacterium]